MKKIMLSLAAIATSSLIWTVTPTTPAEALCISPREAGEWVNVDNNTRGITRAQVRSHIPCNDQPGITNNAPLREPFSVRLFGACVPTDCVWEEAGARPIRDGWLRGYLDQGFAKRTIWIKAEGTDRLRVHIQTDFVDPNREDYSADNYLVRR